MLERQTFRTEIKIVKKEDENEKQGIGKTI